MVEKKKIKTNPTERRFGVILENIDSKLDSVVEGHVALDKKIDTVADRLDGKIDALDYKVKTLTEMTAKNTENIEIMKSDIELIKNSVKRKIDAEEFEALEKRVILLERKISRGTA